MKSGFQFIFEERKTHKNLDQCLILSLSLDLTLGSFSVILWLFGCDFWLLDVTFWLFGCDPPALWV